MIFKTLIGEYQFKIFFFYLFFSLQSYYCFCNFLGVLAITIISVNYFTHTSWYLWRWGSSQDYYAPCHGIEAVPIWQLKLPKLGSESNIRLVNISKDSHLDLIMGFGTGKYF